MKFNKVIKEIQDNNEFFDIDYKDLLANFDTDDIEEKVKVGMDLSLVNVAFVDSVRGEISRPRFINKILTIFRKEFLDDIRYRIIEEEVESKEE
jgi:hypothetical protein